MELPPTTILERARDCITLEADALHATRDALGPEFVAVVQKLSNIHGTSGKLILSGVGKSAHIAQKLVGTFNSTGLPACFLDATQALHGDLGLCAEGDVAILLSNSGQSDEVLKLVPMLKRFGITTIALTSSPESDLATGCDLLLSYVVPREACPLALAPTASTTAALALGDAVAMVLLESRGFTRDDFARFHPAGNLGRLLLLKVGDLMRSGDRLAVLPASASVQDAILAMTKAKAGSIALTDPDGLALVGILTDGDFRRSALTGPGFLDKPASTFMTANPRTVAVDATAVAALRLFELHRIDDLIVVDGTNRPVGVIDNQDLPKLRLV